VRLGLVCGYLAAAACILVSGCASPGYPYVPASPIKTVPVKPATAHIRSVPASIIGVYSAGLPESYAGVDQFAAATGTEPNVVMYFSSWQERFQTSLAQTALRHGAVPFVEMEPATVSMASIAAGQQDKYLRSYAEQVRSFGQPVIIGFAHEMNGWWYPWGWTHTRPKVYISAWRHVVTLFRAAGADNVTWLWIVNGIGTGEGPIHACWPGPKYVSWVGIDNYYDFADESFSDVFDPTLQAIRAFTKKPVLIAETGIGQAAGQAAKLPGLFTGMRTRDLLGFVYFDIAQNDGIYHQDWRIDGHPIASAEFGQAARGTPRPG
jgi:mannan endo-1,4-beta-mannosidase